MRKVVSVALITMLLLVAVVATASAYNADTLVSVGSLTTPFSKNKQNEPALAVDASHPDILVAGANDEIDEEACNVGDDTRCPFTDGVGVSGVYFSFDSGSTWHQPTFSGWTARDCMGIAGPTDLGGCNGTGGAIAHFGAIGTLPWYYENGLVSDGDPAVAFGPRRGSNGQFSWANGSRLYYANLTANFSALRSEEIFRGFEAIAVSRLDAPVTGLTLEIASNKDSWMKPVIVSQRQSSTTFGDKEQVWADNAASSHFFGNVYICWASFRSVAAGPAPLQVAVSSDGGDTWTQRQLSAAANNSQRNPVDGCTVRTDSNGVVYVFGVGTQSSAGHDAFEFMVKSYDGGASWTRPVSVAGTVNQPGIVDPVLGRPTIDGIAGARSDLAPAPSVDIANGAPTGSDATNRIVMTYVSGPLATPHVYFTESSNGGNLWSAPRAIESAGDRGYYTAPAISPNGTDVYVVYNAFTTPYRNNTTDSRNLVGVMLHADVAGGMTGAFSSLHRSPGGDPRGSSQNNLVAEFLGDYVYAVATRTYGAAVWNDARNAADCPAIDTWRMALRTGDTSVSRPAPTQACAPTFGNSDIFGGSFADPTP